ncbi:thioesterase family protein [Synechococcus sp. UW105]|uniref:acyl-CoA thioesterase n=1 Tax=Synechococcus sp. UW105 TaxID=337067 RepID=UPI000E0F6B02|nr:thioesterase family protein [Synechococcus sp. UW105]
MNQASWLELERHVRFGDTDAAGVMHFHQLLRWCHEAWEESLERYGVAAAVVFPGCRDQEHRPQIALPVIHCEADFLRPVHGGDQLCLTLQPERINPGCFEVHYLFQLQEEVVARGLIRHLAINAESRQRCPLPEAVDLWLEASGMGRISSL